VLLFFIGVLIGGLSLLLVSVIYVRRQRQEDQEYKIALTNGLGFTKTHLPSYNKGYEDGYDEGYTNAWEDLKDFKDEEENQENQEEKKAIFIGWIKTSQNPLKTNSPIDFYPIIGFNFPYGYN